MSYVFEYTGLNQLKKASVLSNPLTGNTLKTIEYSYDAVGRRISRNLIDNVDSSKSNTKKYYYDGENIIAELDENDNLMASYTHSPLSHDDILGATFTSAAVGKLSTSTGSVYYLKDHLSSVNEVVNSNGDVIQKYEYSVFGIPRKVLNNQNQEINIAQAPVRTSFTYTGREYEPELGMYYYRARYYDPNNGRFLQQDPDPGKLANPNTFLSKYVYTANNPVMYTDPSGEFAFLVPVVAFLIEAAAAALVSSLITSAIQASFAGGNFVAAFNSVFVGNLVTSFAVTVGAGAAAVGLVGLGAAGTFASAYRLTGFIFSTARGYHAGGILGAALGYGSFAIGQAASPIITAGVRETFKSVSGATQNIIVGLMKGLIRGLTNFNGNSSNPTGCAGEGGCSYYHVPAH